MKKKIVTIVDPKVDDLCALFAHITARATQAECPPSRSELALNDGGSTEPSSPSHQPQS